MFQCPNCRAYTDLSAEVDDTNDFEGEEEEEEKEEEEEEEAEPPKDDNAMEQQMMISGSGSGSHDEESELPPPPPPTRTTEGSNDRAVQDFSREADLAFNSLSLNDSGISAESQSSPFSLPSTTMMRSANIDIPARSSRHHRAYAAAHALEPENSLTPMNDSGPFGV